MRLSKSVFILIFVILLAACSKTDEPKIVGTSSGDVKAAFAFEDWNYTIQGGFIRGENVGNEIGQIEVIVNEITQNGEAVVREPSLNLKSGAKIYNLKEGNQDNNIVAININDKYYAGILHSKLN